MASICNKVICMYVVREKGVGMEKTEEKKGEKGEGKKLTDQDS